MPEGWLAGVAALGTIASSAVLAGSWSRRQRVALDEEIALLGKLDPREEHAHHLDAVIRLRLDRYRQRQERGLLGWLVPAMVTTAVWWFLLSLPAHAPFVSQATKEEARFDVVSESLLVLLALEMLLAMITGIFKASGRSRLGRWMIEVFAFTPSSPRPRPQAPPGTHATQDPDPSRPTSARRASPGPR